MNFRIPFLTRKPKPGKKWREFVCYVKPFMEHGQLAMMLLQKANDLGLAGQKIKVVHRVPKFHIGGEDEIWFEGEVK